MLRFFSARKKMTTGLFLTTAAITASIYKSRHDSSQVEPRIRPEGNPKEISTLLLEAGSKVLQSNKPLKDTTIYFVGFHPMKDDPCHQMEAHHYCKQVNEDFAQCVLYDGNTEKANLTGLEYIISEKLYDQLEKEEKKYWHPHNYEILSGQLVAPGLPSLVEKQVLKKKMNSYGKTFHTWRAKCWEGEKPYLDTLPKGDAILAWSFNHEGEAKAEMIETRDKNMDISTTKKRESRQDLIEKAHPQNGVNYLASKFKKSFPRIPGVREKDEIRSDTPGRIIEKPSP
jgi:hypothetical protein